MAEEKNDFLVVSELPSVEARLYKDEEGKSYELITIQEALKKILNILDELAEGLVGKK